MTREAIDKVGLLDEQYFFFMEEVDWFYRLRQLGGVVYYFPEAQIIHHYAQSINQTDNRSKYLHENRYRFVNKYHGKIAAYLFRIMLAIDSFFVISAFFLLQSLVRRDKRKEFNWRLKSRWRTLLWAIGSNKGGANWKASYQPVIGTGASNHKIIPREEDGALDTGPLLIASNLPESEQLKYSA